MQKPLKILVIRLSSMGDIIYTTPVVRCLKMQLPGAE
ncbi:MAG: glycosyl transferase, partial [Sphingobacteriaceae bacterium]